MTDVPPAVSPATGFPLSGPEAPGPPAHTRGRLFGRNVLEALFQGGPRGGPLPRRAAGRRDEATGRRYLFRVVDVSYGTEHREPGWAERVAGTLLADDARGESGAHPLHEQAARTYRLAECRCLGTWRRRCARGRRGRCSANPRAFPPSSPASSRPPRRTSRSWRSAWETCPSGACAAARPSSTSRSAFPGPAWPAMWDLRHHGHGQVQSPAGPAAGVM